jgi:hypothetical protein
VTTRDVLDLLEADRDVPLPARYALTEEPDGSVLLHVLVRTLPSAATSPAGHRGRAVATARLPAVPAGPRTGPPTAPVLLRRV